MAAQEAPNNELIRMRTWKLDAGEILKSQRRSLSLQPLEKTSLFGAAIDAPKLHLDELLSPAIAMSQIFSSDPSTPTKVSKSPVLPSSKTKHVQDLDKPARLTNGSPRPPISSEPDSLHNSPGMLTATGTPTNELNNPWSSAVGKATAGGKSGRVIERLMNDNDRLLREKKLAVVRLEEEIKRGESARSALESLQVSNGVLTSLHESDAGLLIKRDRRIQELREDLEAEKSRRCNAEKEAHETKQERDETLDKVKREAADEREQSKRATTQYEILSRSWNSLESRYLKQAEVLRADLSSLRAEIDGDKRKLTQLEIITEQLRQEAEKNRRAKEKLSLDVQDYKLLQEESMSDIRRNAQHNEAVNNQAQQRMEAVMGEMKYVVNVKRDFKGVG